MSINKLWIYILWCNVNKINEMAVNWERNSNRQTKPKRWYIKDGPFLNTSSQRHLMSLYGSSRAWSWGWRPALEVLAPVVLAQLCAVSDTCSTSLVSGSQSVGHHCHLAKIVPSLVWLLALYLSWAAFVVGRARWRLVFLLMNVNYYDLHLMTFY